MTTEADERRVSVRKCLQEAIEDLSKILVGECHGHDEYKPGITEAMTADMATLIEMRNRYPDRL